jgi:hypothetical protein
MKSLLIFLSLTCVTSLTYAAQPICKSQTLEEYPQRYASLAVYTNTITKRYGLVTIQFLRCPMITLRTSRSDTLYRKTPQSNFLFPSKGRKM